MRKVSWRLLPLLGLLYVASFLDRTNVGLAALQMNRDLGLSAATYGFGAGIFFLGYALFEVPSNLVLARMGARRWIARIAISWGIIASAMMFVRGPSSFYALRFLLGVAEAGLFPGAVYYLALWFPERDRARALARFILGLQLSAVVGGPLGGWLLSLNGYLGLAGWQWLFLVEGIPPMVLGVVAFFYLTDRPEDATWLAQDERAWLTGQLARDESRTGEAHARGALASARVWWFAAFYLVALLGLYTYSLWLPIVIRDLLGVSDMRVGMTVGALGVVGVVGMLVNGARSDRTGERLVHTLVPLLVAAAALIAVAGIRSPIPAMLSLVLVSFGLAAFLPPFWCLPARFLRGAGAAAGIALIGGVGNLGGFIGPSVFGALKESTGSFRSGLLAMGMLEIVAAAILLFIVRVRYREQGLAQ